VTGNLSGDLSNNINLIQTDDFLLKGNSNAAEDTIEIFSDGALPVDQFENIVDEKQTMIGELSISLVNLGVIEDSIVVQNLEKTVTYITNVDYVVEIGDGFTSTTIRRTGITSAIGDGENVLISYDSGENIRLLFNDLIRQIDESISSKTDPFKHATADVLIKNALETRIDLKMRVKVREGFDLTETKAAIQTEIAKILNNKSLGESVFESNIISIEKEIPAVEFIDVPKTEMARADGSFVVRELATENLVLQTIDVVRSYVSEAEELDFPTIEGGGFQEQFGTGTGIRRFAVNVVQDDFFILETVNTQVEVARGPGRAFIGADGKITISLVDALIDPFDDPNNHKFDVTYRVFNQNGAQNILVKELEFVRLNSLVVNLIDTPEP